MSSKEYRSLKGSRWSQHRLLAGSALAAVMVGALGCGGDNVPVRGKVISADDQSPLEGGFVMFSPVEGAPTARSEIQPDGSFPAADSDVDPLALKIRLGPPLRPLLPLAFTDVHGPVGRRRRDRFSAAAGDHVSRGCCAGPIALAGRFARHVEPRKQPEQRPHEIVFIVP